MKLGAVIADRSPEKEAVVEDEADDIINNNPMDSSSSENVYKPMLLRKEPQLAF